MYVKAITQEVNIIGHSYRIVAASIADHREHESTHYTPPQLKTVLYMIL